MKTLGKLKLKEEKMLSSEELLGFRGGSGVYGCGCAELTVANIMGCTDSCLSGQYGAFDLCMCCCKARLCGMWCV